MDNPQGKVVAVRHGDDGTRVSIDVDVSAACPRCAEGKGCGAGIFGGRRAARRFELPLPPGRDIEVGATVTLDLHPRELLQAAVTAYGLPLAGAAVGAALAYALSLGDAAAAAAALAGVGFGIIAARQRLQRNECLARFEPRIR